MQLVKKYWPPTRAGAGLVTVDQFMGGVKVWWIWTIIEALAGGPSKEQGGGRGGEHAKDERGDDDSLDAGVGDVLKEIDDIRGSVTGGEGQVLGQGSRFDDG